MSGPYLFKLFHRIQNIVCPVIGLADHLPLFAVRKHCNQRERPNVKRINNNYIQYRNMKRFDAELFKQTLMQTPWILSLFLMKLMMCWTHGRNYLLMDLNNTVHGELNVLLGLIKLLG